MIAHAYAELGRDAEAKAIDSKLQHEDYALWKRWWTVRPSDETRERFIRSRRPAALAAPISTLREARAPDFDELAPLPSLVPSARVVPIGPQERLVTLVGAMPEYSTSHPERSPWLYLLNDGDADATEVEVYVGGSLVETATTIRPGEAVQVTWPSLILQIREATPQSVGERLDFRVIYKSPKGQHSFTGDMILGKDGTPMLIRGGQAGERSSPYAIK